MAYEPTIWKDGDLVTSAKLNKLEQGVANGGGILIAHADKNGVLDKTWQEIYNGGFGVILWGTPDDLSYEPIIEIVNDNDSFMITTIVLGSHGFEISSYITQSSNGYPVQYNPNDNDNDQELPK